MREPLRAEDLLPLIAKLPRDQRVRLAKLALSAAGTGDAAVYAAVPVAADELASDEDSLGWDAEGWDEFLRRGESRWYTFAAPDKRRPVLLLTRDEVIDSLTSSSSCQ